MEQHERVALALFDAFKDGMDARDGTITKAEVREPEWKNVKVAYMAQAKQLLKEPVTLRMAPQDGTEQFNRILNTGHELLQQLVESIYSQRGEMVNEAVAARLGEGFDLADALGRMTRKTFDDGTDVICLDGEDILHFHPTDWQVVDPDAEDQTLRVVQRVMKLTSGEDIELSDTKK